MVSEMLTIKEYINIRNFEKLHLFFLHLTLFRFDFFNAVLQNKQCNHSNNRKPDLIY